jgi:hypothetical protein
MSVLCQAVEYRNGSTAARRKGRQDGTAGKLDGKTNVNDEAHFGIAEQHRTRWNADEVLSKKSPTATRRTTESQVILLFYFYFF